MKTIFEKGSDGRKGCFLPELDVPNKSNLIPKEFTREKIELPDLSEIDVVRHYTKLSTLNYGLDSGFYPLGSCTMKYNPKINEDLARLEGFTLSHPLQPEELSQGNLQLMHELEKNALRNYRLQEIFIAARSRRTWRAYRNNGNSGIFQEDKRKED